MELSSPVRFVKGVGEARERAFLRLGVRTVEDLLFFFPRRYEDRRDITPLSALTEGAFASVVAEVISFENHPTYRKGLNVASALLCDGKDTIKAVWFNRAYLGDTLMPGVRVALYGKVERRCGLQLSNPEFEVLDESDPESVGRIVPIYPATAGLSSKWVRRLVFSALDLYLPEVQDYLPEEIVLRYDFPELRSSVMELHRPNSRESWLKARNRLAFDELFLLQTGLLLRKKRRQEFVLNRLPKNASGPMQTVKKSGVFLKSLPFRLTGAQERAIREITSDLASETPMNRLLQGDVGSGKTAVAVAALVIAVDSGFQAAFMVPTEILAQQHFFRLNASLESLGIHVSLLSGSLSRSARKGALDAIASGKTGVVVGTHAIFSEKVVFNNLGLVIIDEQHRFGVMQKNALMTKGRSPHVLVMTATPIPRALTLSIYGDLDVSLLDELPPGRKSIKTCRLRPSQSEELIRFIDGKAKKGRQIYWICPLIEESEQLNLSAAYSRFQDLRERLPDLRIELLHGQLSASEKETVMSAFEAGETNLLVATSVVEVGVDVPNATVMVIEDAAHFGIAQLHQLRGRVGRGEEESHCFLLVGKSTPEGAARIEAVLSTSDGFRIAEMDLKQRGPGEICGIRQHGVTDFRVADLVRDRKLMERARQEAAALVAADPGLLSARPLAGALMSRLGATLELAGIA